MALRRSQAAMLVGAGLLAAAVAAHGIASSSDPGGGDPAAQPAAPTTAVTTTSRVPATIGSTMAAPTTVGVSTVRTQATLTTVTTVPRTTSSTTPACDPTRFAPAPATGTDIDPPDGTGGLGTLDIDNGLTYDATVKLVAADSDATVVRHVVVRAGEHATLGGIGEGTYRVLFSRGRGWNASRQVFACDRQAREFSETLTYREVYEATAIRYSTWKLTLHGVAGGTAQTKTIDIGAFDQIGAG